MEKCVTECTNHEKAEFVRDKVPDVQTLQELAEFFKVFGDSTRIKILTALGVSELCVCDIAEALEMTQSAISHQLKVLKQDKLIKYRKDGKLVYYSLDDSHIQTILDIGMAHIKE